VSGGSYDYLCFKGAGEFGPDDDNLLRMIDRLKQVGYAQHAHATTEAIRTKLAELQELIGSMEKVWYAVEWTDSCDWGEDRLRAALIRYEAEHLDDEQAAKPG
jgi:hypothetical protein